MEQTPAHFEKRWDILDPDYNPAVHRLAEAEIPPIIETAQKIEGAERQKRLIGASMLSHIIQLANPDFIGFNVSDDDSIRKMRQLVGKNIMAVDNLSQVDTDSLNQQFNSVLETDPAILRSIEELKHRVDTAEHIDAVELAETAYKNMVLNKLAADSLRNILLGYATIKAYELRGLQN